MTKLGAYAVSIKTTPIFTALHVM